MKLRWVREGKLTYYLEGHKFVNNLLLSDTLMSIKSLTYLLIALDSGLRSLGSSPAQVIVVCSLAKYFNLFSKNILFQTSGKQEISKLEKELSQVRRMVHCVSIESE